MDHLQVVYVGVVDNTRDYPKFSALFKPLGCFGSQHCWIESRGLPGVNGVKGLMASFLIICG